MAIISSCNFVYSEPNEKKVLIINSYDRGLPWTEEQSKAIIDALESADIAVSYNVEYLDWKQFNDSKVIELQKEVFAHKYTKYIPDLIITTDDAALKFILNSRAELFPAVPIVFSGVLKENAPTLIGNQKNVVGVYEDIDPEGTIQIALKVNPNIKDIYVVHDNTESGIGSANDIKAAVDMQSKKLNIHNLNDLSIGEITKEIAELSKNSIVIVASYSSDAEGLQLTPEEFVSIISNSSNVPVYDLYRFRLGYGTVGGSLLSGRMQGQEAAALALKILSGTSIEQLQNVDEKTVVSAFDYTALKKHQISLASLPKGSVVINNPYAFLEAYRNTIIIVLVLFLLMMIYITILNLNIQKRKTAEGELKNRNKEMIQLYEELAASEEELFAQVEELVESQRKLDVSEDRYRLAVEASNDAIWDWDVSLDKRYYSNKWYEMLGYKSTEIESFQQWANLVHPEDYLKVIDTLNLHLDGKSSFYKTEYRIKCASGAYIWIQAKGKALFNGEGKPYRMIGAYTDITEAKNNEEKMKHLAYFDALTQLPNRASLTKYVNEQIDHGSEFSLIYFDMDNFKLVNDTFGHSQGDLLLREIGSRISGINTNDSRVFRIGGDEFVIILKNLSDRTQLEEITQQLIEVLKVPVFIGDSSVNVSISAGIVSFPMDGETFEELLKNADAAMYDVKEKGKNSYRFFDRKIYETLIERLFIERELSNAIENNELKLYYQPQIDTETGEIKGFEALLRWFNSTLGSVPPNKFIKIAEETGLIISIGEWVIKTACTFAARLQEEHDDKKFVSINISTLQLRQEDFVQRMKDIIEAAQINPAYIHMEITETVLMDSFEDRVRKLNELRAYGIEISLDDFGTGYSSLTYLRKLPINTLKIDKSFIDDISTDENNQMIINTIIQLAHGLNIKVVAEGVEEQEQYMMLAKSNCDLIQGYYISKPVSEEDILKLVS